MVLAVRETAFGVSAEGGVAVLEREFRVSRNDMAPRLPPRADITLEVLRCAHPMDRAQIRHVAELAELELTDAEEERLATEIGRIVAYFAELDAIDTKDVPPTAHVMAETSSGSPVRGDAKATPSVGVLRPDEPEPGLTHEDALAGAPRAAHGGFSVPTFVE